MIRENTWENIEEDYIEFRRSMAFIAGKYGIPVPVIRDYFEKKWKDDDYLKGKRVVFVEDLNFVRDSDQGKEKKEYEVVVSAFQTVTVEARSQTGAIDLAEQYLSSLSWEIDGYDVR